MNTDDLLKQSRAIWGDDKLTLEQIIICLGKIYGDLCLQARTKQETGSFDETEVKKELGNTIVSLIRWTDGLGYEIEECLQLALTAQKKYAGKKA